MAAPQLPSKPPIVNRGGSDEKSRAKPPQPEEKKRGGWGNNGPRSNSNNGGQKNQPPSRGPVMKKATSNNVDDADNLPESLGSPDNKKKKQEDWNYLKQTLKSNNMMNGGGAGQGGDQLDPNLLTFHEKADELVEEEEELRNKHLEYLKEAAKLLTEEGELISNVQGFGNEEYDMDEYVNRMERIIKRNLEIYGDLQKRIVTFKKHMAEEEEAH